MIALALEVGQAEPLASTPYPGPAASLRDCERAYHQRRADAGVEEQRALDQVFAGWLTRATRPAVAASDIPWTSDGRIDWSTSAHEDWYLGELAGCDVDLRGVTATPETTRTTATFRLAAAPSVMATTHLVLTVDGRERWVVDGGTLSRGVTLSWSGHPAFHWTLEGHPPTLRATGPEAFSTDPDPTAAWSFDVELLDRSELTPGELAWNAEIPIVEPLLYDCHWAPHPLGVPVRDRILTVGRDGVSTVLLGPAPQSMTASLDAGTWSHCDAEKVLARWRTRAVPR